MSRPVLRLAAALALGAAVLATPPARATVVVDQPIGEMAQHSVLVVRGTVTAQKVEWTEGKKLIVTRTFVRPTEVLKGKAGTPTVIVRQVGGSLDGMNLGVQGMARFKVGEDVVLFLEQHPQAPGEFVLEGMAAAKFTVMPGSDGPVVQRALDGLVLARHDAKAGGIVRPSQQPASVPNGLSYRELVRQVRAETPALPAAPAPSSTILR